MLEEIISDTPDDEEATQAADFLRRIVTVSGENVSDENVREVKSEVQSWLATRRNVTGQVCYFFRFGILIATYCNLW